VTFDVSADSYLEFMGRYSEPLAHAFLAFAELPDGGSVLDVGCGPGVITELLAQRPGAGPVAAIDPSPTFVEATRARLPDVDVRQGGAEAMPWDDGTFDAALAGLVVHFMSDPVAGLREMGRVTRAGGVVAASAWDHAGGGGPLSPFWRAAVDIDPAAPHEADLPGTREGHLASLATEAGLDDVASSALTVQVHFASYDAFWAPYLLGVGPLGAYVSTLGEEHRRRLRERLEALLPEPPFDHAATAWVVRARA
jgi:SAM-dependent methyltransferase